MPKAWEAYLYFLSVFLFNIFGVNLGKTKFFTLLWCWIAGMLERSWYFKIALAFSSVTFSTTESGSKYFKIFKFFNIFEMKLFSVSALSDSVIKTSPFSPTTECRFYFFSKTFSH